MKSWRVTQAGLQKVMNIPRCAPILRNCHSEWSEIKNYISPGYKKATNTKAERTYVCLMLPLIQDKAWQPAPSNVTATEASKQRDYTTWTAKKESGAKRNRKKNNSETCIDTHVEEQRWLCFVTPNLFLIPYSDILNKKNPGLINKRIDVGLCLCPRGILLQNHRGDPSNMGPIYEFRQTFNFFFINPLSI